MRPVAFHISAPKGTAPSDLSLTLLYLLHGLVAIDKGWLKQHGPKPLYESGVRYRLENETEAWLDVGHVLSRGYGDCEDLASWRVAELQLAGIEAQPHIEWRKIDGRLIYHILVWRKTADRNLPPKRLIDTATKPVIWRASNGDGWIEDPSRALGMGRMI